MPEQTNAGRHVAQPTGDAWVLEESARQMHQLGYIIISPKGRHS